MSASFESKTYLRKIEFPFCVKEALARVEALLCASQTGNHSVQKVDLANDLIREFIFCEVDRRGAKRKRITRLQELQLLECVCDYISHSGPGEAARNAVFMSLFNPTHPERNPLLAKLVSLSISVINCKALMVTAILMQQLSCTSKFSLQLAEDLVHDFFILTQGTCPQLKELPVAAPLFTANFLTAVTEMYGCTLSDCEEIPPWKSPPETLLNLVIEWVDKNITLCTTPPTIDIQQALPPGAILMPAVTPYAGLIKWCVLSAIHQTDEHSQKLYAQLHLAMLESLLDGIPSQGRRPDHIIAVGQLTSIVYHVAKCSRHMDTELLEIPIIRLAQAIQVALHSKAVYGNVRVLLKQLEILPPNRLLSIILDVHRRHV